MRFMRRRTYTLFAAEAAGVAGRRHYDGVMRCAARLALLLALAWGLTGCFRSSPATLPSTDVAYVAVLSGEMPGSFRDIARHSWIVASKPEAAPVATTPAPRRSNYPRRPPARRSASLRRYEWVGNAHATSLASVDAAGLQTCCCWARASTRS